MATAYQHRPMSKILAPAAGETVAAPTGDKPAATPDTEVPDKYKGKSTSEVIEMHQNAEKELGRVQNEVGTYRGLVSDLSAIQRPIVAPEPAIQEPVDVSGDDLISDPVGTIQRILKPELDARDRVTEQDRLDTKVLSESQALVTDFKDLDAVVGSEEFQRFATRTPGRLADFNTAADAKQGLDSVRAARRLLEDFNDFKDLTKPADSTVDTPTEAARKVATEGSGPATGSTSGKDNMYESEVLKLIAEDRPKYNSPSFQAELLAAIKEGRYVKNS